MATVDVHLLDGTYELFRQFFARPSHLTADGREVAATRGVLAFVLGLLEHDRAGPSLVAGLAGGRRRSDRVFGVAATSSAGRQYQGQHRDHRPPAEAHAASLR